MMKVRCNIALVIEKAKEFELVYNKQFEKAERICLPPVILKVIMTYNDPVFDHSRLREVFIS